LVAGAEPVVAEVAAPAFGIEAEGAVPESPNAAGPTSTASNPTIAETILARPASLRPRIHSFVSRDGTKVLLASDFDTGVRKTEIHPLA
jgi:hypothetical protein